MILLQSYCLQEKLVTTSQAIGLEKCYWIYWERSTSLYIAIFMNDLAIEIKTLGLGITGDHDPFHSSIMHKIKTKQVTELCCSCGKSSLRTYFNKML